MQSDELATTNGHGKLATMPGEPTIGTILQTAVAGNMDIERLGKVFDLYERELKRKAEQDFCDALSRFQAKCPSIPKTKTAKIATRAGGSYQYNYAPLGQIAKIIRPFTTAEGLSYTWDSTEVGGQITCVCYIRHRGGHKEPSKFSCSIDTAAAMSGAQKSAAALTFAMRKSLEQGLGISTSDDVDGADEDEDEKTIDDKQALRLEGMLSDTNSDTKKFLAMFGVERVIDIPVSRYTEAHARLTDKAKKMAEKRGNP